MKRLLLLSLCLSGLRSFPQTHVPMFGEPTRMWTSEFSGTIDAQCLDHWTTTHWIAADSIVDGHSYRVIRSRARYWQSPILAMNCTTWVEEDGASFLVREEGLQVLTRVGPNDEQVVYDFAAVVGDSVPFPSAFVPPTAPGWFDTGWAHVTSIDSVEINGTYRKRWLFEGQSVNGEDVSIVAGIGTSAGPFGPLWMQIGLSHATRLVCVREHGVVIHGEPFCMVVTGMQEAPTMGVTGPHPNPAHSKVMLDDRTIRHSIVDAAGQAAIFGAGPSVDLSNVRAGVYIVHGWDVLGGPLGSWRVVVVDRP